MDKYLIHSRGWEGFEMGDLFGRPAAPDHRHLSSLALKFKAYVLVGSSAARRKR